MIGESNGNAPDAPTLPGAKVYSRREHQISPQQIDEDALKILHRLQRFGYKAFLVGGGVRDLLLGKKPKDFDIATDARPKQIKDLFRNSRIIGRRFKLVHIIFRGQKNIEVSTFRASSGDDPEESAENIQPILTDNTYGTEQTDAVRRDITINALLLNALNMSIVDYVGGMDDINNRLVRVIGDPDVRFPEDPVRLIRVVRHAVRSGFHIEDRSWEALLRNAELIKNSSSVRVYEEVKKDLVSGYALGILRMLHKSELLKYLFPALHANGHLLLRESSPLSNALNRIDEEARDGREYTNATILACIAFFLKDPESAALTMTERFEDEEAINDHILKCFHGLALPRKERERIYGILSLWLLLVSNSRRFHMRRNKEERESLFDLLDMINSPDTALYSHKVREEALARNKSRNERRKKRLVRNG